MLRQTSYAKALAEALDEILAEDERVFLIGATYGGFPPFADVQQKYAARIKWPPIAELAYCGIGVGAAIAGMRPIIDIGTSTFSYEAIAQIVNEAAMVHSNSAGQTTAPVVFHMSYGLRGGGGMQHSGAPHPWYWNAPGLQVAMPACPADAKGLLRWAALRSKSPTVFLSHRGLMRMEGPVPEGHLDLPFGQAEIKRAGTDVTVLACGVQVPRALEAAGILASFGVDAEVIDPRTLTPLDKGTILGSVRKTGHVVVTDESHDDCGVASGLSAIIADEAFDALRAPIKRVSTLPVPVPAAKSLEDYVTPSVDRIVDAARAVTAYSSRPAGTLPLQSIRQ